MLSDRMLRLYHYVYCLAKRPLTREADLLQYGTARNPASRDMGMALSVKAEVLDREKARHTGVSDCVTGNLGALG